MQYLSRFDIDSLGERIFSSYKRLPSLQTGPIERVEPEKLAQELFGLNIGYYHLSKYKSILGVTCVERTAIRVADDAWTIMVCPLDGRTILIEKSLTEDKDRQGRLHFSMTYRSNTK